MCGRYAIAPTARNAWASVGEAFGEHIEEELRELKPRYNIAPATLVPVILHDPEIQGVRVAAARWGFIPHWWKERTPPRFSTINARAEEAGNKPMWRHAFARQRCLIPATHWYEWMAGPDGKVPHVLTSPDGKGFCFAGLWSRWHPPGGEDPIDTVAILTRDAPESIAEIHDRMPVVLHAGAWMAWLDPRMSTTAVASEMIATYSVGAARTWEISRAVNSVRNDGPQLLVPSREDR
ncbi:MAG: SOS response-associated peptidase [Nevskiales bacterium]|nr:SOS response-associated peptidase [Nevskiales bacterium]